MTATYSNKSPWFTTPLTKNYLDILSIRPVSAETDDFLYTIEPQYTHRPDLLAFDLYGGFLYNEILMCYKIQYLISFQVNRYIYQKIVV